MTTLDRFSFYRDNSSRTT